MLLRNRKNQVFYSCMVVLFSISASPSFAQQAVYNPGQDQQEIIIRDLTGQVEKLQYQVEQMKQQLEIFQKDVDFRLNELESAALKKAAGLDKTAKTEEAPAPSTTAPKEDIAPPKTEEKSSSETAIITGGTVRNLGDKESATDPTKKKPLPDDVKALYDSAYSQIKAKNYEAAEEGFHKIIKNYPQHPLVENSYFWMGESYLARKDYDAAANAFLEAYKKFPKGNKTGYSLLKLGTTLYELKQKDQACTTLKEADIRFGAKDADLRRNITSQLKRIGC